MLEIRGCGICVLTRRGSHLCDQNVWRARPAGAAWQPRMPAWCNRCEASSACTAKHAVVADGNTLQKPRPRQPVHRGCPAPRPAAGHPAGTGAALRSDAQGERMGGVSASDQRRASAWNSSMQATQGRRCRLQPLCGPALPTEPHTDSALSMACRRLSWRRRHG